MPAKPVVYVVDDDPAILRVIAELVEMIDLQVETFISADEFLDTYKPAGPGCLVLDVRMPGMSGLELQRTLADKDIHTPIIMITAHGDIRMAVEAMSAGAFNFLEKPFRVQELCDNIHKAIRVDHKRWQQQQQREGVTRRIDNLTPAEREVMDHVVAGKTNKTIAGELGISVRAVEDRRARMMKHLGVSTRAELMELASVAGTS